MIGAIISKLKARSAFNSLNNRDIKGFLSGWSNHAHFIYPGDLTVSGEFIGKQEIEKWFNKFLYNYPSFHFSLRHICIHKLFDIVGSNVVSVEWEFSGKNKNSVSIKNRGVTVIEIKRTKAIRVQDYIFDQKLLGEAWGEQA